MDKAYFFRDYFFAFSCICMLVMMASCGSAAHLVPGESLLATSTIRARTSTRMASMVNQESTMRFTLSGGKSASYTLHAATPISKLRHGHREFTIDITQEPLVIFLVFYGYTGPKDYTLSKKINGGDVHISLGDSAPSWDLSTQPEASCAMTVASDSATALAGLDRMKGSFSCPQLFSSNPTVPQPPVTVRHGSFDIAMLVES